jgi:hypothetical protein
MVTKTCRTRIGVAGFFVVVRLAVHDSKIVKNSVFLQA